MTQGICRSHINLGFLDYTGNGMGMFQLKAFIHVCNNTISNLKEIMSYIHQTWIYIYVTFISFLMLKHLENPSVPQSWHCHRVYFNAICLMLAIFIASCQFLLRQRHVSLMCHNAWWSIKVPFFNPNPFPNDIEMNKSITILLYEIVEFYFMVNSDLQSLKWNVVLV